MGAGKAPVGVLQTTTIASLREREEKIDELVLLSHDPGIYLIQVTMRGCSYRIVDQDGMNLMFRSQMAAKKAFVGIQVLRAVLEHQSSYDEMIGQEYREQPNRLQVPISFLLNV